MSIFSLFPYPTTRHGQDQLLQGLWEDWDKYDVHVIEAPTGFGKTPIAKTVLNWRVNASYIAPTNMLVEQFLREFPQTPTLAKRSSYWCDTWRRKCEQTVRKEGGYCRGCACGKDRRVAIYGTREGAYNYHIYNANNLHREVLVVDEAHNLINFLRDQKKKIMWQHTLNYPNEVRTYKDVKEWLETYPKSKLGKRREMLLEEVSKARPNYLISRGKFPWNGSGTKRGFPEDRDALEMVPLDIHEYGPQLLWPKGKVNKIVLLSATINEVDIKTLGLNEKRVRYYKCPSPIPRENRPVHYIPVAGVNRLKFQESTEKIAGFIRDELLPQHEGEAGVIHATYAQATILKKYLGSEPRLIWHSPKNAREMYGYWRNTPRE